MLQYPDINSITIVDPRAVRPRAVVRQLAAQEATRCTRQDHTCISERHDEAGTITTVDCSLSTRMFLRQTRLTYVQAVATLLASVNDSTPSSVSTQTASRASTDVSGPTRCRSSCTTVCSGMWMEVTFSCFHTICGLATLTRQYSRHHSMSQSMPKLVSMCLLMFRIGAG